MFPTLQQLTFLIIIFRSCTLEKLSLQHLLLTVEILLKEPSLAMEEVSSKVKTRKSQKSFIERFLDAVKLHKMYLQLNFLSVNFLDNHAEHQSEISRQNLEAVILGASSVPLVTV